MLLHPNPLHSYVSVCVVKMASVSLGSGSYSQGISSKSWGAGLEIIVSPCYAVVSESFLRQAGYFAKARHVA